MEISLKWREITFKLHLNVQDRRKYRLNSMEYIIVVNGIKELSVSKVYSLGVIPVKNKKERDKVLELFHSLTNNKYKNEKAEIWG